MISRRAFLHGLGAAVVAPVIPASVLAAPPLAPISARLPAWAVGTVEHWDWQVVRAIDEQSALTQWVMETGGDLHNLAAVRQPDWDEQDVVAGDALWFAGGMGAHCARCSCETFIDDGGDLVGETIVCEACMTLDDWRCIDPENKRGWADDLNDADDFAVVPFVSAHVAAPSSDADEDAADGRGFHGNSAHPAFPISTGAAR